MIDSLALGVMSSEVLDQLTRQTELLQEIRDLIKNEIVQVKLEEEDE